MCLAWTLGNEDKELGLLGRIWILLPDRTSGSQRFQSSIMSLPEARNWQSKSVLLGAFGCKSYSAVMDNGGPDQNETNRRESLVECASSRLAITVFQYHWITLSVVYLLCVP